MMKVYSQPTCHYCKRIKDTLTEANIEYEEIITSENTEEWNELIRITGLGMTPTIIFQNEIWLPNRDFRTPEELVARVNHFQENPMKPLHLEEKIEQINNAVKNLTLLLNQMSQSIQRISTQVAGTPPPPPPMPSQPTPEEVVQRAPQQ
jgi:glutaredoxin